MRTDQECTDISYLCGRALAVMHRIEEVSRLKGEPSEMKRETNAMRYMGQFVRYPRTTLLSLQIKLRPYLLRLTSPYYENLLNDIISQIGQNGLEDTPLSGKFVLGYHAQLHDLKFGYQENKAKAEKEE